MARYLKAESSDLFSKSELRFEKAVYERDRFMVREDEGIYHVRPAKKRLSEVGGQQAPADN